MERIRRTEHEGEEEGRDHEHREERPTDERVIDPVADYATMMETLVDFDKIRKLFASGFSLRFDAMHAVTVGPRAPEARTGGSGQHRS